MIKKKKDFAHIYLEDGDLDFSGFPHFINHVNSLVGKLSFSEYGQKN